MKKQIVIEVKSIDSSIVAVAFHSGLVDDDFTAGKADLYIEMYMYICVYMHTYMA